MTKQQIVRLLGTLRADYVKGLLLVAFLDGTVAFFIVRIITFLISTEQLLPRVLGFSSNFWSSLLAGVIVFVYTLWKGTKKYSITEIERAVPTLSEMISAVKDSLHLDNIATEALRDQVVIQARHASSAGLVPIRKVYKRIGVIFGLMILFAALPLFSGLTAFLPDEFPSLEDLGFVQPNPLDPIEFEDDSDLYGEATLIQDGVQNLEITVDLTSGGGDFSNPLAWQNKLQSGSAPILGGVDASIDSPAIERLPAEFELAKSYNLKIKQIT